MKKTRFWAVGIGVLWLLAGSARAQAPKGDPVTGAGFSKDEAMSRLKVVVDLRYVALAMEGFVEGDRQKLFPPADGSGAGPADAKVGVGLSWRAHLVRKRNLEFTQPPGITPQGLEDLRGAILDLMDDKRPKNPDGKPREPWDDPRWRGHTLDPFRSPVPGKTKENWHTFYRVFLGKGAAFEPDKQLTLKDITDGPDKTILVVEAGEAVPWPKPDELVYDPAKPLPKLGGLFPDGFYAAFADGTVRFVKGGTDEKLIRALVTRNGGEKIAELPPKVDTQALRKAAGYKD